MNYVVNKINQKIVLNVQATVKLRRYINKINNLKTKNCIIQDSKNSGSKIDEQLICDEMMEK